MLADREKIMNNAELKRQVEESIDSRRQDIIDFGQDIFEQLELGFKETRTTAGVLAVFKVLGLHTTEGHVLTGVRGPTGCHEHGLTEFGGLNSQWRYPGQPPCRWRIQFGVNLSK
jgi:hypothetical protein